MTPDAVPSLASAALREKIAAGRPIVGRQLNPLGESESDSPDIYALYHMAKFPGHGMMSGLMPFCDANRTVMELAARAIATAKGVPVLAGVAAGDPFRLSDFFLKEIKEVGFAGIQNFPSVGIMDGAFRSHMESSGGGYAQEVDMIGGAHELGLLTAALVFNADEAVRMTEAGADILVIQLPIRATGFLKRANRAEREEILTRLRKTMDRARSVREDVVLMYGSYLTAGIENSRELCEMCPGFDGYWITAASQ